MKIDWTELKEEIKQTDVIKRYRRILKIFRVKFDPLKIKNEALSMHQGRLSRSLEIKATTPKRLTRASQIDTAYRARMVELSVELKSQQTDLKTAIKEVKRYLLTEWSDRLANKKLTDRRMFFDRFTKEGEAVVDEIFTMISMLDKFVEDIDKAGYSLKLSLDCLKLTYAPERII